MFKLGAAAARVPSISQPQVVSRVGALSSAIAMRAFAAVAVVALAASCLAEPHAHLPRALLKTIGISDDSPAYRLLQCSEALGPSKCISALSTWRCKHALDVLRTRRTTQFDLRSDVERFPWEQYRNVSDDLLNEQLVEGTEKLLRYRSLSLHVPGYTLDFGSKGNGTLNVDILKSDVASGRGTYKKILKDFYNLVPIMMLPGLLMSAIIPFILPALKMMTVFAGMVNNMALSGAVFTLLRNNAFGDHYEKKVIYVNEGYKNEKLSPLYFKEFDYHGSASNVQPVVAGAPGDNFGDLGNIQDLNNLQDYPGDWLNQNFPTGYGNLNSAILAPVKLRRSGEKPASNETTT